MTDTEAEIILTNLSAAPTSWKDRIVDMRETFCTLMREGHSPADSCILAWASAWGGLQMYCPKIETLKKYPTLLGSRNQAIRLTDAQYSALERDIEQTILKHGQGSIDIDRKHELSSRYRMPVSQLDRMARDARRRLGIRHPKQKATIGAVAA